MILTLQETRERGTVVPTCAGGVLPTRRLLSRERLQQHLYKQLLCGSVLTRSEPGVAPRTIARAWPVRLDAKRAARRRTCVYVCVRGYGWCIRAVTKHTP